MKSIRSELVDVVEAIWTSTLGLSVESGDCAWQTNCISHPIWARIDVKGDSPSTLLLECSEEMAREVASHMFRVEALKVSSRDLYDSVGELVNIIGGNIRAMLSSASSLGLPDQSQDLRAASMAPEHGRAIEVVHLECQGMPFHLTVQEFDA